MYFLIGITAGGLLMGMPLAFGFDVSKPPVGLTEWFVFVISLCGVMAIVNSFFVRFILKPAIQDQLKTLPTRAEFAAHDQKDTKFQEEVERFMDNRGPKLRDRY
jgi:hypothetical protein